MELVAVVAAGHRHHEVEVDDEGSMALRHVGEAVELFLDLFQRGQYLALFCAWIWPFIELQNYLFFYRPVLDVPKG